MEKLTEIKNALAIRKVEIEKKIIQLNRELEAINKEIKEINRDIEIARKRLSPENLDALCDEIARQLGKVGDEVQEKLDKGDFKDHGSSVDPESDSKKP